MPRQRRLDRQRIARPLGEVRWLWLCGIKSWEDLLAEGLGDADFDALDAFIEDVPAEPIWNEYREDALRYVAEVTPGRRPPAWWCYEAPEPRLQVSGHTIRVWHRCAHQEPGPWDSPSDWRDGEKGYWVEERDPLDPPRYESQAAYLRRHKMLLPGEAKRLKKADYSEGRLSAGPD